MRTQPHRSPSPTCRVVVVYFAIGVPLCVASCALINPGAHFDTAMDRQEVALRDLDGDGFPDHLSSTGSDELAVAKNLTGRTNLLRKVTRPLGATIELDYARAGNTFEQPHSQFVLSRVVNQIRRHLPGGGSNVPVLEIR